jgi:hypothetical protein
MISGMIYGGTRWRYTSSHIDIFMLTLNR